MTKTDLIQALESAIGAAPAPEFGAWKVSSGDSYVQLVWTCDADEAPEMYGDEPWSDWGGNAIIEAAGAPGFADSGSDAYVDRFSDDAISQWVEWRHFSAKEIAEGADIRVRANWAQAADNIQWQDLSDDPDDEEAWKSTPFQVADAGHNADSGARIVSDWLDSEG